MLGNEIKAKSPQKRNTINHLRHSVSLYRVPFYITISTKGDSEHE